MGMLEREARDFPSLIVSANGLRAQGAFAQAQAEYLDPDENAVAQLKARLSGLKAGIVAHYYMDVELQAVLGACDWPWIHISDSLLMADKAVEMAEAGARMIVVLGVDFMAENVRAMLDANGFHHVAVYRAVSDPIGCSLAESAESSAYAAYLAQAEKTPNSLHVVYINTSLRTKARAHATVPTITCTSSNVVQTVLQAFAQEPQLNVWFGPDTYMGENLQALFESLLELDDEKIRALHPAHSKATLRALLPRFHYFKQGNCIVHHLFGGEVVERVRQDYGHADITAHLEVPGEMFELALEASRHDRGVIGSTANILNYIVGKVEAAAQGSSSGPLRFVLGTEAGMITSIVERVQQTLRSHPQVEVEIIFPVAQEAVKVTGESQLPIVPGVSGGEGCSTAGGCATCPYMKLNSLDALLDLLDSQSRDPAGLRGHRPRSYRELVAGKSVAEVGCQPILHMRSFQRTAELSEELLKDVRTRNRGRSKPSSTYRPSSPAPRV